MMCQSQQYGMGSLLDISGEYQQQFQHMVFFMVLPINGNKPLNIEYINGLFTIPWE